MPVTVLWNTRHRACDIAELLVDSPLPCRPALVPGGRVAHSLRRELIRIERTAEIMGHLQKLLAGGGS
jgi:hypothetical protein